MMQRACRVTTNIIILGKTGLITNLYVNFKCKALWSAEGRPKLLEEPVKGHHANFVTVLKNLYLMSNYVVSGVALSLQASRTEIKNTAVEIIVQPLKIWGIAPKAPEWLE